MNKIPTPEEFERASAIMRTQARFLDQVSEAFKAKFRELCNLHYFSLIPEGDMEVRATVFFEKDGDIVETKQSGLQDDMIEFLKDELEHTGRGARDELNLECEFDSYENVIANYEGDYFLRLR